MTESCGVVSIPSRKTLIQTHVSVIVHVQICVMAGGLGTYGQTFSSAVMFILRFTLSDTFMGSSLNVITL